VQSDRSLFLGFVAAFALMACAVGLAFWGLQRRVERERWVGHTDKVLSELNGLFSSVRDIDSCARGFALSGKDIYIQPLPEARSAADSSLKELRELTVDNPDQQKRLEQLGPLIAEKLDSADRLITARRRRGQAAAAAILIERASRSNLLTWRSLIRDMQREEQKLLKLRTLAADRAADYIRFAIVFAVFLGCATFALALQALKGT
jgi:CHASE3 domain sensor protein